MTVGTALQLNKINLREKIKKFLSSWQRYYFLYTFRYRFSFRFSDSVITFFSGESFKAHRLVLAACSSHFSKLFSNSSLNGQLIVILDGTRHQDLQILLQFMYRGVAYLHQDRIESVLRTAEVLQVGFYTNNKTLRKQIASI